MKSKLIFAGTPDFAVVALQALHSAGHDIMLVLTQPDRPAGRGLHPLPSAVKGAAQALGIPVQQPASLKDRAVVTELARYSPDAMVVAAYGLIIPPAVLAIPRRGCINIHASLLPRWRGAAPIQRALLAGDTETGISIMQMDKGLDTGPVLLRKAIAITSEDTAQTLHDRLARLGGELIVRALAEASAAEPQDDACATYAAKIDKREALIDWSQSAEVVDRQVRAFNPTPGAATIYDGIPIKIWRSPPGPSTRCAAGTIVDATRDGIFVACGGGTTVRVLELQRAGGKRLTAGAFLAGCRLEAGTRFVNP